jgi:transcriptional regulator with XRE-family HTH domain
MRPVAKIIAEQVRQRRKELKITQQQLADRLGMRQSAIARIESGVNDDIGMATCVALAQGLDVSLEYLVGMQEPAEVSA